MLQLSKELDQVVPVLMLITDTI